MAWVRHGVRGFVLTGKRNQSTAASLAPRGALAADRGNRPGGAVGAVDEIDHLIGNRPSRSLE
jgi:hypothetical protein